jgi:peptide/nickel transport system ATP-binding protein
MSATPLLELNELSLRLPTAGGDADAVRAVSLTLRRGQTLGIVGESGSGKSLTALSVLGLWPERATVNGSIRFDGQELVGMAERELCSLRGNRIGMVFQEPMTALNPVQTIGRQVAEPMRLHQGLTAADARSRAVELLHRVGIADAARRVDAWPHQFSGGQRQRITIAMALACGPELLIADEPTSALDVTVAGEILRLIDDLVRERHMALILISHDLGVIARHVGHTVVMYGGMVVESGPTREFFAHRAHPYTRGLFGSHPALAGPDSQPGGPRRRLPAIAGIVPELHALPPGCPFADRCTVALPACTHQRPAPVAISAGHQASCLRLEAA